MKKYYIYHYTARETLKNANKNRIYSSKKGKRVTHNTYKIYIYENEVKEGNIIEGYSFKNREEYKQKLEDLVSQKNYYNYIN